MNSDLRSVTVLDLKTTVNLNFHDTDTAKQRRRQQSSVPECFYRYIYHVCDLPVTSKAAMWLMLNGKMLSPSSASFSTLRLAEPPPRSRLQTAVNWLETGRAFPSPLHPFPASRRSGCLRRCGGLVLRLFCIACSLLSSSNSSSNRTEVGGLRASHRLSFVHRNEYAFS